MEKPSRIVPRLGTREGRYYAIWYDETTRRTERRSLRTRDAVEAKAAYARFILAEGDILQSDRPKQLTVRTALEDYIREHIAKECADWRRPQIAAAHLIDFFGDKPLTEIDIPLSRAYAAARRAGKVGGNPSGQVRYGNRAGDSTIRRELGVLAAAANHAKKWKRISVADMPSIERTRAGNFFGTGIAGEAKFFSREQIALLLFHAHGETRDIIKLCYYTGARRASIENITVGQIDFVRRKINLATPGKRPTKKRQPVVPLFDVLFADLQRLCAGKGPGDRLFGARQFPYRFNLTCRALEFAGPHHPHMLRHARATHLLQDGKNIYDVAALLGDTITTVVANYGHHSPNELKRALE